LHDRQFGIDLASRDGVVPGDAGRVREALTIVLASATVRGWRRAGLGSTAGLAALALIVAALGPLVDRVPLHRLQLVIGVLLLLFDMRWLRKANLRSAGVIPLHDEASTFAAETLNCASGSAATRRGSIRSQPLRPSRRYCSKSFGDDTADWAVGEELCESDDRALGQRVVDVARNLEAVFAEPLDIRTVG
jgi:hypothetical protein